MMKRCRDCGELKSLSAFTLSPKNRDGRGSYCKPCFNQRAMASRDKRAAREGREVRRRRVVPLGQKYCSQCDRVLPLDAFASNRSNQDGLTAYCKPCHNRVGRENRIRLHGSTREYHLRRRYGIGAAEVDAMIGAQGGTCAVCAGKPEHVDHDHVSGRVRGILCFNCNQALGNARDDPRVLIGLVRYLRKHGVSQPRLVSAPSHLEFVLAEYLHGRGA